MGVQADWRGICASIFDPAVYTSSLANFLEAKQVRQQRIAAIIGFLVSSTGDYDEYIANVAENYPNYDPYVLITPCSCKRLSFIVDTVFSKWSDRMLDYDDDWAQFIVDEVLFISEPTIGGHKDITLWDIASQQGAINKQSDTIIVSMRSLATAISEGKNSLTASDLVAAVSARCGEFPYDVFDDPSSLITNLTSPTTDVRQKVTDLINLLQSATPSDVITTGDESFTLVYADTSDMNGFSGIGQIIEEADGFGEHVIAATKVAWNALKGYWSSWMIPTLSKVANTAIDAVVTKGFKYNDNSAFSGLTYPLAQGVLPHPNNPRSVALYGGETMTQPVPPFSAIGAIKDFSIHSPIEMYYKAVQRLPYSSAIRFPLKFGDIAVWRDKGNSEFEEWSGCSSTTLTGWDIGVNNPIIQYNTDGCTDLRLTNNTVNYRIIHTPTAPDGRNYVHCLVPFYPASGEIVGERFDAHQLGTATFWNNQNCSIKLHVMLEGAYGGVQVYLRESGYNPSGSTTHYGHREVGYAGYIAPGEHTMEFKFPKGMPGYQVYIDGEFDSERVFASCSRGHFLSNFFTKHLTGDEYVASKWKNMGLNLSFGDVDQFAAITVDDIESHIGADQGWTVVVDNDALDNRDYPGWGRIVSLSDGHELALPKVHYSFRLAPVSVSLPMTHVKAINHSSDTVPVDLGPLYVLNDKFFIRATDIYSQRFSGTGVNSFLPAQYYFSIEGCDPYYDSKFYSNDNMLVPDAAIFQNSSITVLGKCDDLDLLHGFNSADSLMKFFLSLMIKKQACGGLTSTNTWVARSSGFTIATMAERDYLRRVQQYLMDSDPLLMKVGGGTFTIKPDNTILNSDLIRLFRLDNNGIPRDLNDHLQGNCDIAIYSLILEWWKNTTDGMASYNGTDAAADYCFLPYEEVTSLPHGSFEFMSDSANECKALVELVVIALSVVATVYLGTKAASSILKVAVKRKAGLLHKTADSIKLSAASNYRNALEWQADLRSKKKSAGPFWKWTAEQRQDFKDTAKLIGYYKSDYQKLYRQGVKVDKAANLLDKVTRLLGFSTGVGAGAAALASTVGDVQTASKEAQDRSVDIENVDSLGLTTEEHAEGLQAIKDHIDGIDTLNDEQIAKIAEAIQQQSGSSVENTQQVMNQLETTVGAVGAIGASLGEVIKTIHENGRNGPIDM